MRNVLLFSLILLLPLLAGCPSAPQQAAQPTMQAGPEWYMNPPSDPNFLYAAKSETSQDLQRAIDKAVLSGRQDIAQQVEVRITSLQKKFDEETGMGQDSQLLSQFTSAVKAVAQVALTGSKVKKQEYRQEGGIYRAFCLVEYPIGAAQQQMRDQIRNNEQMYTRFRATQSYKEMDDEATKYEEWKKSQGK